MTSSTKHQRVLGRGHLSQDQPQPKSKLWCRRNSDNKDVTQCHRDNRSQGPPTGLHDPVKHARRLESTINLIEIGPSLACWRTP